MKIIEYEFMTKTNVLRRKTIPYSVENLAIAEQEAYNGKYEVVDVADEELTATKGE